MVARPKTPASHLRRYAALYLMALPGFLCLVFFRYMPMYGLIVAFKDFRPTYGYLGSAWVGLKHFRAFFQDPYCWRIIRNTFIIGLYGLCAFPAPVFLALAINELRYPRFKRVVQTISYMPYFLSIVVVAGLIKTLFSTSEGVVNTALKQFGLIENSISFLNDPAWFRSLYIGSGIWQSIGFSSIIYLGAMANIDPELYEAAVIDGASRLARVIHITIPSILPTVNVLFILAVGGILGSDFQKILLLYTPRTYQTADVLSTYVYRMGIEGGGFSYSSAVGLLSNVASMLFLLAANLVSAKIGGNRLL